MLHCTFTRREYDEWLKSKEAKDGEGGKDGWRIKTNPARLRAVDIVRLKERANDPQVESPLAWFIASHLRPGRVSCLSTLRERPFALWDIRAGYDASYCSVVVHLPMWTAPLIRFYAGLEEGLAVSPADARRHLREASIDDELLAFVTELC